MAASARFAEMVLPLPIDQIFSYSIPDSLRDMAQPGCRAFVSFRNRLMTGVITGMADSCPVKNPKPLLDVLDHVLLGAAVPSTDVGLDLQVLVVHQVAQLRHRHVPQTLGLLCGRCCPWNLVRR